MNNPWWHLKHLPWRSLIQATLSTVLLVLVLEIGFVWAADYVPGVRNLLGILFSAGLGNLTQIGIAIGVGAIAVVCLEYFNRPGINTRSLWGLVLCLAIAFLLRKLIPPPPWLVDLDYLPLVGMVLGVFWQGGHYWRSGRRW
jgi:hypothetical protein